MTRAGELTSKLLKLFLRDSVYHRALFWLPVSLGGVLCYPSE